jgi:hypothetical protein
LHLLPLLVVPIVLLLIWKSRSWGLFAEVPKDPQARAAYLAHQGLTKIREVLTGWPARALEGQRLLLKEGWLEHQDGALLHNGKKLADCEAHFEIKGTSLKIEVRAKCEGCEKKLVAQLPLELLE